MIPTVTYTTRHRNTATVTTGGRSVTMTTLEVRTCPNCSRISLKFLIYADYAF